MPRNITGTGRARRVDGAPPHRRTRPVALLLASAILLAACAGAAESGGAVAEPETTEPDVAEVGSPGPAPADSTVTAVDYAFDVGDVSAGDTVALVNGSDSEAHEMVVMKVNDDSVTLEDIRQLLLEGSEGPPPEFLEEAGFAFALPGETAEQTVTLDAARYVLLCFIPVNAPPELVAQMMESSEEPEIPSEVEAELGPPHAVEGMVALVDVE